MALDIYSFLEKAASRTVIDVRTPAEFEQGHIPGAVNVPLFSNEERAVIGTLYKQDGSGTAIRKGLEFVGPKMKNLADEIRAKANENEILIHCWRGGMRSSSVAWLMELNGITAYTLQGGYKAFRKAMRHTFEKPWNLIVLGGCTGSGKSKVLLELEKKGQTIIDLEAMARHKGSAFGHLGEEEIESQECFENRLAWVLYSMPAGKTIWIEDESKMIGKKNVPQVFYELIRTSPVFVLDVPLEARATYLTKEYGKFSKTELIEAFRKIEKRIGPEQCKKAIEYIETGNLLESCKISLVYYDKAYTHGLSKRLPESITRIPVQQLEFSKIATALIKQAELKFHGAH
ncbi:MAG: tRNA 2-selenouridine(34) synthase MnmH [Flavobacteriales bacterium]